MTSKLTDHDIAQIRNEFNRRRSSKSVWWVQTYQVGLLLDKIDALNAEMIDRLAYQSETFTAKYLAMKARVAAMEDALREQLHHPRDSPATCGACGTPAASCDTDCMAAARMAEHDAKISRALYGNSLEI